MTEDPRTDSLLARLPAMTQETHHGIVVQRAGSGPALVLLHGGRGSWNHWIRNIDELSQHYSLYIPDLPGFGASLRVARDLPYDEYLALVARAVSSMTGNAPFLLAGFSFGSLTAALLMGGALAPKMQRLSLLAPAGWGGDGDIGREKRKTLRGVTSYAEKREVLRYNLAVSQLADPDKVTEETVDLQVYNITNTNYNSLGPGSQPLLLGALAKIRCPLQVMVGTGDISQKPSVVWRMARVREAAPHARIDLLEGAGHWAQYELPDAYNALLVDFLQDRTEHRA